MNHTVIDISYSFILLTRTIHITDVTTAEHITMSFGNRLVRTNSATINLYISSTEDITVSMHTFIGVRRILACIYIGISISSTTAEHITFNQSTKHSNVSLTSLGYCPTFRQVVVAQRNGPYTYGSNLTATIKTVTHYTIVEIYVSIVCYYRTFTIAGAIDITLFLKFQDTDIII